jgi:signal peptidase I
MTEKSFTYLVAELLSLGHSVRFRANGQSMHPTIRDGEIVTVMPITLAKVRLSDIILYRTDRGVVAHRVMAILNDLFTLRGDSSDCRNELVAADRVLGKVVAVKRGSRSINLEGRTAKMIHAAHLWTARLKWAVKARLSGASDQTGLRTEQ